jgi:Ca2+-binding EF-hand superfamily protein
MPRFRGAWRTATLIFLLGALTAQALPTAAQIRAAFVAMDTTGNDALNLDEWDRASFALFRAADKNKNDFIDPDELQASNIAQDTFLRADTDHDGRLSLTEFMELRRALFHLADIDRDDHLLYVEYELFIVMEQFGWNDRNRDGIIQLSELRETLVKAFEALDTDHDGQLSPPEAAFMPAAEFKAFDKNHDGGLTLDEFIAGYRATLMGS